MTDAATAPNATAVPDRAAIRSELETTRDGFHALLTSLSDGDWKKKSANPAWTVGQLVYHLSFGAGFAVREVESAKKGKGFNPPAFVINPLNVMATRLGAMRATRESIVRKYDDATTQLIAALDTVQDGDWQRSSTNFGVTNTVEHVFHIPAEHLAEHAADIRKGLGRE